MSDAVTFRQKQFLRQLGYKGDGKLTKQQASQLIEKLLAEEKASGKTFSCPYCKAKFGPRPKREKKCSSCGNTIVQLSGKFYTQSQADSKYQTSWLKESRQSTKSEVNEEWKQERQYRKEYGEPLTVGYSVSAGPDCPHTKRVEGLLFLIEDVYDKPDMLPPFDECKHDTCECGFTTVLADEVKKKTRIAEFSDRATRAKLTTRKTSSVAVRSGKKSSGCFAVFLVSVLFLLIVYIVRQLM